MHERSTESSAAMAWMVLGISLSLAAGAGRAGEPRIGRAGLPDRPPGAAMSAPAQRVPGELPFDAQLRLNPSNGTIVSLKAANLSAFLGEDARFQRFVSAGQWGEASLYYLHALGSPVRLDDPSQELEVQAVDSDALGYRHVRLRQRYSGLPVWGGEIIVHWNARGAIYLIKGDYLPTPSGLSPRPMLEPAAALEKARSATATACPACVPELGVFRGGAAEARLAYRMRIPQGISNVWQITLDAHDGEVLEKILVPR